jgi:hypothetical protein
MGHERDNVDGPATPEERWLTVRHERPLTRIDCQARKRLPEQFFSTIARLIGRKLEDQSNEQWLWKGRHVYMFDGTTMTRMTTLRNSEGARGFRRSAQIGEAIIDASRNGSSA